MSKRLDGACPDRISFAALPNFELAGTSMQSSAAGPLVDTKEAIQARNQWIKGEG